MNHAQALAEARTIASGTGIRRTVRGLRFRDGWRYFTYEAGSALDWGIRTGDRHFWQHVKAGSPGTI